MEKQWMENEVVLGTFGRTPPVRVESFAHCNETTGIIRPEGSLAIKQAKDYLIQEMKAIGLDVYFDNVGNLFGRRKGLKDLKCVATGSHVDTVNNSGQLDGAYGVIAALEVMRRLEAQNFQNIRPVEMVVFMGEEGSDFEEALLGSDVLCGKTPAEAARQEKTHDGRTLGEITDATCSPIRDKNMIADTEYFVESHIEQAGILENEAIPTGCVYAIAGLCHLKIQLTGQENHAGANPMWLRRTPVTPAGAIAVFAHNLAKEKADGKNPSVATVDTFHIFPNSPSVIPGSVEMTIDIRDNNQASMYEMRDAIIAYAKQQAEEYHVDVEFQQLIDHNSCPLSQEIYDTVMEAAGHLEVPCRRMFSGAIHDALNIAQVIKTGMIFVPSQKGISHSPFEWTDWAAQEKGIDLLEETIKILCQKE